MPGNSSHLDEQPPPAKPADRVINRRMREPPQAVRAAPGTEDLPPQGYIQLLELPFTGPILAPADQ